MSLINDALKKAQRDRDPLTPTDALGAGSSGRARARTPARHWLLVLGSGALVLVVLSVAFTLFWTTPDTPPRKATAVAPAARPASPAATATPAPAIVPVLPAARPAPAEAPPAAVPTPPAPPASAGKASPPDSQPAAAAPRPEPAAASAPAKPVATVPPTAAAARPDPVAPSAPLRPAPAAPAAPVAAAPASPPSAPAPAAPARPDEKINAFIGTLRVAGVRALGEDSRVLINDRVYRVNDVIDRALGIRLVKVEPGSLHFVDGRGVAYVKYL
jgi:hypothetical protein